MTKASGEVGGRAGHHLLTGSSRYELNKEAGVNLEHIYVSATHTPVHQKSLLLICVVSGISQLSIHLQGWNRVSLSTHSINI